MKKNLTVLLIAILLPLSAFAGSRKKQAQPDSAGQQQDGTDWLNAPTPDGSPTLKETSDWLEKTLHTFAGAGTKRDGSPVYWNGFSYPVYEHAAIDNQCNFRIITVALDARGRMEKKGTEILIPLGAIKSVATNSPSYEDSGERMETDVVVRTTAPVIRAYSDRSEWSIQFYKPMPDLNDASAAYIFPKDTAPRVKSALEHAAALCQGTFKAPAQSKEPF